MKICSYCVPKAFTRRILRFGMAAHNGCLCVNILIKGLL